MSLELFHARLDDYLAKNPEKLATVSQFRQLVQNRTDAFLRTCFEGGEGFPGGHVTGSLLVTSPDHSQVLLMQHRALGKLLQFGGHSDGDMDTLAVATRECMEESGLMTMPYVIPEIADIELHEIPENPRKGEPAHRHYDILFIWEIDPSVPLSGDLVETEWVAWYSLEAARTIVTIPQLQNLFTRLTRA